MPDISEKELFEIVGLMYEAAQAPTTDAWKDIYLKMSDLFRSGFGGISVYNAAIEGHNVFIGNSPQWYLDEYFQTYQHQSPFRSALANLTSGEYFNRQDFMPDDEYERSPIYKDFYERAGLYHYLYLVFLRNDGIYSGISFTRPKGEPSFSENEIESMLFLLPHFERAFNFFIINRRTEEQTDLIAEAFDRLPQGVIVVACSGEMTFANRTAQEILDTKDGLYIDRDGKLRATARDSENALTNALNRAFDAADGLGGKERTASVARSGGKRPLELLVTHVSTKLRLGADQNFAIIYVTDADATPGVDAERLVAMYGLTPSEAKIAVMLATGNDLASICKELEISSNTCRTHLKRIFSKTDTRRQGELVKLILSGSGSIRSGS
jgi:DNA-binding CsgD family transcriptional regulator/PAS domain-containing protein